MASSNSTCWSVAPDASTSDNATSLGEGVGLWMATPTEFPSPGTSSVTGASVRSVRAGPPTPAISPLLRRSSSPRSPSLKCRTILPAARKLGSGFSVVDKFIPVRLGIVRRGAVFPIAVDLHVCG